MSGIRATRYAKRTPAIIGVLLSTANLAAAEPLVLDFRVVAGDEQSGGPAYDFRICEFEVRNDQFVVFLNDALADPDDERGQYTYFDTLTGDVYVNSSPTGEQGAGPGSLTTKMFSPAVGGQIEFVGGQYQLVTGDGIDYANHPVAGVSWYGAVKFCNWLTVQRGIPTNHRCYTEAPSTDLAGWHPATITDYAWALRDLSDAERLVLVSEYLGYRLPMDHETLQASPYNEWYKAAAYNPNAPATMRVSPSGQTAEPFHWIYGFGRDDLHGADANYLNSGDPFDNGVTPVGVYDGSEYPPDYFFAGSPEFTTSASHNYYGVHDLAGNVWEWIQGHGSGPDRRCYRGGGWNSLGLFVENTAITNDWPEVTPNWVGLRIVQADPGLDPTVEPGEGAVITFSGPLGGPFVPDPNDTFTITSRSLDSFDWEVSSDVAWLDLDAAPTAAGTLQPFDAVDVTVLPNDTAEILAIGAYSATLSFSRNEVEFVTRSVELEVTGLLVVDPPTGLASSGPVGGPFFPDTKVFTLTNGSEGLLPWQVTATESWVLINGAAAATGSLAPGLSTEITVALSTPGLNELEPGNIHTAFVEFKNLENGASTNRPVLVSVGLAPLTIEMAIVPGHDAQPDGPQHSYRIGVHEITNAEFLAFLNDAYLHPEEWRGHWMYHDTDSGDVYIHGSEVGAEGTDGSGILMFDASDSGRIEFDGAQYRVVSGTEDEPVVGVSWFGAVKFCNWLTVRQGMLPSERAYIEGADPGDWHPATIAGAADWLVRDLDAAERAELVARAGFRLPMDDGGGGAGLFDEWYKAAAWNHKTPGAGLTDDTTGATHDGGSSCDVAVDAGDLWWTYTPAHDGTLTLELTFDPVNLHLFSVHTGCPGTVCNEVACDLDGPTAVEVMAGETYWIRVATRSVTSGPFTLTIRGPGCADGTAPPADGCPEAPPICPGEAGTNTLYAFGRDELGGPDANYWNSGDPFDNSVTPVGWFDGVHLLDDGTTETLDTENGFGLYDLCGNVSEWVQDQGDDPMLRAMRGGNWQDAAESPLLNNLTRGVDAPESTRSFVGFRVVQSQSSTSIRVSPESGLPASGPVGGTYEPDSAELIYTLTTAAGATLSNEFTVSVDATWLTLNGDGQTVSGLVQPGHAVDIGLSFNEETDALRAPEEPIIEMSTVPASHTQPEGPAYSFRIARYETTNEQFVEFLNNALTNPSSLRGHYTYFDIDTGDVYINATETGGKGAGPGALTTLLFDASSNSYITFDASEEIYAVEAGFERHPATGVSWFGALKYCNWLSLQNGMGAAQRTYTEGPNVGDWHAVTISTCDWWGTEDTAGYGTPRPGGRDLTDAEGADLVNHYAGYRLPMDHGEASAAAYNEWYKAGAWDQPAEPDPINHDYGFGRDEVIHNADANFNTSGDPFEPGTTPVGFYDGTHYNDGSGDVVGDGTDFLTTADQNAYALFDMTGNVAEWVQDLAENLGGVATDRGLRGGHLGHDAASPLLKTTFRDAMPADATSLNVGFRVVQAKLDHVATLAFTDVTTGEVTTREIRLRLTEPMSVEPDHGFDATGLFGGPFSPTTERYILTSTSATAMDWQVTVTQSGVQWLNVNGAASDSGQLTAETEAIVDVAINNAALTQPPGEYSAAVHFENLTTGYAEIREFTLNVGEPLEVTPDGWLITAVWSVPFDPPAEAVFEMTNISDADLAYTVTTDATWITLDYGSPVTGTLAPYEDPADAVTVTAQTNEDLTELGVGEYEETITFRNDSARSEVARDVHLTVKPPLEITPAPVEGPPDFQWQGSFGGPFVPDDPPAYTVENVGPVSFLYEVTVAGADWLEINGGSTFADTLLPGSVGEVSLSVNANANVLSAGVYTADLSFTDDKSEHTQSRTVALVVGGNISVAPVGDFAVIGREGGPFTPPGIIYTLANVGEAGMLSWTVSTDPPVGWVMVDGQASASGSLAEGEAVEVVVSIDTEQVAGFDDGVYTAVLRFEDGIPESVAVTRTVSLIVVEPQTALEEQLVSASVVQPGGPVHSYFVAAFQTTNADFAAFLNDARANLDNERGQYLFFDLDSGDVYINDQAAGAEGTAAPSATLTTRLYDASVGRVQLQGDTYLPELDFEHHPVVGVSWYGALKYCNWLTLDQGLPAEERCYTEADASNLDGWHPVTISDADWAVRNLTDDERADLVATYRGYRLPMDGLSETASIYNEWYKAAAWDAAANGGFGANHVYGFGRDTIVDGADANYRCSGDPFEDELDCLVGGTTPVGYYGGPNREDTYPTNPNDNGFGLFDMSGNVYEWMQGRFSNGGGLGQRTLRGGGWNDRLDTASLQTTFRTHTDAPLTHDQIGFRVMRTLPPTTGDADQDGDVDQDDFGAMTAHWNGPGVGVPPESALFDFNNDGDVDLADFAAFQPEFTDSQ